jgi:hypothetical protein
VISGSDPAHKIGAFVMKIKGDSEPDLGSVLCRCYRDSSGGTKVVTGSSSIGGKIILRNNTSSSFSGSSRKLVQIKL